MNEQLGAVMKLTQLYHPLHKLTWRHKELALLLLMLAGAVVGEECPHPSVPSGATYTNITGGHNQGAWTIKYICDIGFELFGSAERECSGGKWSGILPSCSRNVARYKPATSSSEETGGDPSNAVDGTVTTVHEGRKCTETKSEKSPWWAVDLLTVHAVKHVRITTRCCDDLPVKNIEIRVGNSTTYKDNPMCNWIPGSLPEGETKTVECVTEDANGRYVSLSMTGATGVLSLCEVEIFSPGGVALGSCNNKIKTEEVSVFNSSCYWFVANKENERDNMGYSEASKACREVGYNLAYDVTREAASFIRYRLESEDRAGRGTLVWLGAERDTNTLDEAWKWNTGEPVSGIFWGEGQPNNYKDLQNCAVLDRDLDWKWNDLSCKINAKTVCKGSASLCSSPPVGEGTWYSGDRALYSEINYQCPIGHKPMGKQTQTCLTSGQWSGAPITCEFVECNDVPGLLDGGIHVLDGRTTYGARVQYKCNEDFSLIGGNEYRTCELGGWTGAAPRCEFTRCPALQAVQNAEVKEIPGSGGVNRLGAKVIYTCSPGHVASGSLSRECELGGDWSGSEPVCKFVDCGNPAPLVNGDIELADGRTTYNAEIQYSCKDDYTVMGDTNRRCEANGRWSRGRVNCKIISCPAPRSPAGGKVSGYNYEVHRKIEYTCFSGHKLEGDPVQECLRSGDWSGKNPRCKYVDCGKLDDITGGRVSYLNRTTHLGSRVKLNCADSYQIQGPKELVCHENGQWRDEAGNLGPKDVTCKEIRCQLPPKPNNTVVSISSTERLHGTSVIRSKLGGNRSYKVGSMLKYRCERGFLLDSDDRVITRECTNNGTWTAQPPECTFIDCGEPPAIQNGNITLQNNVTYYNSMAVYSCDLGFKLTGIGERRTCSSVGAWRPAAPLCEETLCKNLTVPAHTQMTLTTLRIGGRATFKCDFGYALSEIGDHDLECLSSGSWSGWPPACEEVDCKDPFKVENSKILLVDKSTKFGSTVEYHCDPGYTRDGPFKRECEITGYWSGQDPVCYIPRKVPLLPSIPKRTTSNVVTTTSDREGSASGVGVWIGVALGLIVVIGLLIVGIYFYRKQQSLQTKPSRDNNNAAGLGVMGLPAYGGNGSAQNYAGGHIGARPPPPIQMYSIDDTEDHRNPIYDTIPDGDKDLYALGADGNQNRSTFSPPSSSGYAGAQSNGGYSNAAQQNGGYSNEYDVAEGGATTNGPVGTVTINGIAV